MSGSLRGAGERQRSPLPHCQRKPGAGGSAAEVDLHFALVRLHSAQEGYVRRFLGGSEDGDGVQLLLVVSITL